MPSVRVLDDEGYAVIGSLLTSLRDEGIQKDRYLFRSVLRRLGILLAHEVARDLPQAPRPVTTPLGVRTEPWPTSAPVLATMLRAGIPLLEGMLDGFTESDTIIVGAARREGEIDAGSLEMTVDLSYQALTSIEGKTLIYVDPMIATGSTLRAVHPLLLERTGTPERVIIVGAIAYRGVLADLSRDLNASIIVASADEELNEHGYIVPGLGDAGDLVYGKKF